MVTGSDLLRSPGDNCGKVFEIWKTGVKCGGTISIDGLLTAYRRVRNGIRVIRKANKGYKELPHNTVTHRQTCTHIGIDIVRLF